MIPMDVTLGLECICVLFLLLFRHNDNSLNAKEERLPHAIVVQLHERKGNFLIHTPEPLGTTCVWAEAYPTLIMTE